MTVFFSFKFRIYDNFNLSFYGAIQFSRYTDIFPELLVCHCAPFAARVHFFYLIKNKKKSLLKESLNV